jgi:FdhE protein
VTATATDEVLARLEALAGRAGVPADYVRFRAALLRAQAGVVAALAALDDPPSLPRGAPVRAAEVPLDPTRLIALLRSLRSTGGSPSIAGIAGVAERSTADLEELVRAACAWPAEASIEAVAAANGLDVETCLFFGRALAAPFVTDAVRRHRGHAGDPPVQAGPSPCPCCGAVPALAIIRGEEGGRVLCCSLCGHEWASARASCPFCGGVDALGVLAEPDGPRWVETCDGCRRYLKTVDERKLGGATVIPLVETTGALYLDMVAEQHGYERGVPYASVG